MTTAEPRVSRQLRLRLSAHEPGPGDIDLELRSTFRARWIPADPASTARPWIRSRLVLGDSGSTQELSSFQPESGELPRRVSHEAFASARNCRLEQGCELNGALELELGFEGASAEGTVEVDWDARATVFLWDMEVLPAGFALTLTEP